MIERLPDNPTLQDYQAYVSDMEVERGFTDVSTVETCLMLGEEVGEVFKAVRKAVNMRVDQESRVGHVGDELADAFMFMCAIANRLGIDMEEAFRCKETMNDQRSWQRTGGGDDTEEC